MNLAQTSYVGLTGHAASALLFLVLSALLLTSWRGRLQGGLLLAASIGSLAWSVCAIFYSAWGVPGLPLLLGVETLRNIAWFAFMARLLVAGGVVSSQWLEANRMLRTMILLPLLIGILLVLGYVALSLPGFEQGWFRSYFSSFMLLQSTFAIATVAIIEQVFRLTPANQRWALRYLFLSVGGMLVFDFIVYSDALLFQTLRPELWNAKGYIAALAVPLIAITATRNPEWSVRVFVSRGVVFHSTIFLAAGAYLLLMAGAGYYVRSFGGEWADVLQTVLIFAGLIGLLAVLLSKEVRTRVRLFLAKNFYQNKYEYGEEWLRFTEQLASRPADRSIPESVLLAFCDLLGVEGGALWLHEPGGFMQSAHHGNSSRSGNTIDPAAELLGFFEHSNWIVNLEDPESVGALPLPLPRELIEHPRSWLVVPLVHNGQMIACLSLTRSPTAGSFNWEDRDLLTVAGKQAAGYLALLQATDALAEARQFEAYNRLSAFVVHDLKNIVTQLELVISNAVKHGDNPAFVKDAFATVENATRKINAILGHLRRTSSAQLAIKEKVSLATVIANLLQTHAGKLPQPQTSLAETPLTIFAEQSRLEMILGHLLQNAREATGENGHILISTRADNGQAVVEIEDDGCGMSEEFIRHQLFKPFQTTKGNAGMGIGVYEARDFVHGIGGSLRVASTPGKGSTFTLTLPLYHADP